MRFKNLIVFLLVPLFFIFSCGPSQAQLDAQATQEMADLFATQTAAPTNTPIPTPTPIPTNTPLPTPTIIPGKFLNLPEYLESTYYPDWVWQTNPQGLRMAMVFQSGSDFTPIISYEGNSAVMISALFMKDVPNTTPLFIEYIPSILDNFLAESTQEEIYQFMEESIELGTYNSTIDSFSIVYEVAVFREVPNLNLTIWQIP